MSSQRHRIRRQVLEVILQDQGAAWELSAELSRIQRHSLEAIIDRCCTEVGDPEGLHRIDSLEVDLGHIHSNDLEHELIERLSARLPVALAVQVRAEDQATSLAGTDAATIARLELIAFFARSGTLPWWADASKSRVLDEAVGFLLQHAGKSLVALVLTLAHSERELRRLLLHCEDERLWALFDAIAASAPRALAQRPAELHEILTEHRTIAGVLPSTFKNAVWVAVLRAASFEANTGIDAAGFWRGALARVALELGVTYTFLITSLYESGEAGPAERRAAAVLQRLYREAQPDTILRGNLSIDAEAHRSDAMAAIVERLDQLGIETRVFLLELLRVLDALEAPLPAEDLRVLRSLLRGLEDRGDTLLDSAATSGDVGELDALLDQLERAKALPRALSSELRAHAGQATPRERSHLVRVLAQLGTAGEMKHIADATQGLQDRLAAEQQLQQLLASGRIPGRALELVLANLERAAATNSPAQALVSTTLAVERSQRAESPRLDLAYGDSEGAYIENAGLVILWPFLGHLFERLELMADQQFTDSAAQHRAVGLLHHLATQDTRPEEYQLSLAKLLCGMKPDAVLEFGSPITAAEADESANMLTAVIANAPILRDMSIDGLRGSFLLRKGVLGTRDGTWLLRVERATHDVVLDRFPWSVNWVKLAWMEVPLNVEW